MIPAEDVAGIVVSRGDVPLTDVLRPLEPLGDVIVWNNALDEDLSVFGRYQAIQATGKPVVLVVDDDVALSPEAVDGLLAAYEPGKIVANMPTEYRARYTDSCLVGFGAIFERDLPRQAFNRCFSRQDAYEHIGDGTRLHGRHVFWTNDGVVSMSESAFRRTCDVIFTTLTPRALIDVPFQYLPWTRAENRMYRNGAYLKERQRMLELARKVRDAR